ncbi:MAG: HisA/HisF-related TIM barrel protein [Luteimonas sp.]|nr:HisA/HisF-related TIM barrel protein [Luteimonas sp.]
MSREETASRFVLYPAIDVRAGAVVRLAQGDYARQVRYDADPLQLAQDHAGRGAEWLHLVDLDAARDGGYALDGLVGEIKAGTRLRVQTGGGIRGETDVERLFDAGADRVVVGSLAVSEPARVAGWLERYGEERLTVALDARRAADGCWFPASHGWTRTGDRTLEDLVRFHARSGLRHLLCTDIDRDGMLAGPNFELYALLRKWAPGLRLQASGGARDADDVVAARRAGCAGIVLGKALLEGRIDLAQAMRC